MGESGADGLVANMEHGEGERSSVDEDTEQAFLGIIAQSVGVFLLAGLAEIGGGWLVWGSLRQSFCPWK